MARARCVASGPHDLQRREVIRIMVFQSARNFWLLAGVAGLGLIVFGSVWMTAVFARFEKVPADWEQVDELEGTFTFVDEAFLAELQGNDTITGLMSSPSALGLLAHPQVSSLLGSPALAELLGSPDLLAALQNPNLSISDLLQSGLSGTLAGRPQLMELLVDPAFGELLGNPVVQTLLADPSALPLLVDARTQRLLANPADLPMLTVPVEIRRQRTATGAEGNRLFITERASTVDPATGQNLPGFEPTELKLVVDRVSKEYLPGTEGGRSGFWGLPFHVDKSRSFSTWVTAAGRPLDAAYLGTEELQGLETYLYGIDVTNLPLGSDDPATGLPLVVDAKISTWNEPKTGSTVRIEDFDAVSALAPSGEKYPRFVANVSHPPETVTRLVDDAKGNRSKIIVFGAYMPWAAIGLGVILALAAGAMTLRGLKEGSPEQPSASPVPEPSPTI